MPVVNPLGHDGNSNRAHVFLVDPIGGHGGMRELDLSLCSSLKRRGIDVTYVTCDETDPKDSEVEVWTPFQGIYGPEAKWVRALRYWRGLWRLLARVRACRREKRVLIHLQMFSPQVLDFAFVLMAKWSGVPCLATIHDVVPFGSRPYHMLFLKRFYRLLDGLVVHTVAAREELLRITGNSDQAVGVIAHGHFNDIHQKECWPEQRAARESLGLPAHAPVTLFFGTIRREKGLKYLLQAMREVVKSTPEALLLIAGRPWHQDKSEYMELIASLDLGANVQACWEFIPDSQVPLYFRAADVVALPYTHVYQSGVCFRAYAFGRPVVSSAIGGMGEIVLDTRTGFLVPPKDPQALAEALLKVITHRDRAAAMGQAGREWAAEACNWDTIAAKTIEIYGEVFQRTAKRRK